jgi:hypothetical protein
MTDDHELKWPEEASSDPVNVPDETATEEEPHDVINIFTPYINW